MRPAIAIAIAIASLTLISSSVPGFVAPAHAQFVPPGTRANVCGSYLDVCRAARMSHMKAGWRVSRIIYCGGPSDFCGNLSGYVYRYWRP
jgi:hypothetical protein